MTEMFTLDDDGFALLMRLHDGELEGDERVAAERLLSQSPAAAAVWQDLQLGRALVQDLAEKALAPAQSKQARVDLSLLPGQVMRKLPEDAPQRPVQEEAQERGLVAWIRGLGIGKVGFAMGLATAAVGLMVWKAGPVAEPVTDEPAAAEMAAVPGTNIQVSPDDPSVIIEEMEIDSGTLMVHPPQEQGGSTVIWHFQDNGAAQGAGGEG